MLDVAHRARSRVCGRRRTWLLSNARKCNTAGDDERGVAVVCMAVFERSAGLRAYVVEKGAKCLPQAAESALNGPWHHCDAD